jgi:hypothetical protein
MSNIGVERDIAEVLTRAEMEANYAGYKGLAETNGRRETLARVAC